MSFIDNIFFICVEVLKYSADILGITYSEVNVYLFVFILPAILFSSILLNFLLIRKLNYKSSAFPFF